MTEIRFGLVPILGLKTDVPANDPSLMKPLAENVFATHAVGGYNFDNTIKRNSCSKAVAFQQWSKAVNASAAKCLGLFELYDPIAADRDYLIWDDGELYVLDGNKEQDAITTAATEYQKADTDLVSMVRVGGDVIFTDNIDGVTIQAWANGDANAAAAISKWTAYKARYLEYFARRVVMAYTDQTNGDIDIRWSNAIPTAQTDLYFESFDGGGDWQLYVPNDDSIRGIKKLGHNACAVYCEDSINQMVYYPNFTTPFEIYTVVQDQGSTGHHSIVDIGNRHFFFNKNYGFCEWRGSSEIVPISDDVESLLATINPTDHARIVGTSAPFNDEIIWTAPSISTLFAFNYRTNQWRTFSTSVQYLDVWNILGDSYTWTELITDLTTAGYGATPTWNDLIDWMGPTATWRDLTGSAGLKIVAGITDGHIYQVAGATDHAGGNHTSYREEPILDFGNPLRKKLISEIWFDLGKVGSFDIDVFHRSGDTVGEITGENKEWTLLDTISCDSPEVPAIRGLSPDAGARFHQIRWGNDSNNAQFEVNRITVVAQPQGY